MNNAVTEVVKELQNGISVNLVGIASSGRSSVTHAVADLLKENGVDVVRIDGIAALKDKPLAALLAANIETSASLSAIGQAVNTLAQSLSTPKAVLILDDADYLDSSTVGVIVSARTRTPFIMLATSRPGRDRQEYVGMLTERMMPCVRMYMGPMRFDYLLGMVHELLPGTVELATVARIAAMSGGLPGLVRSLVIVNRDDGVLAQHDGQWRAVGNLYNPKLAESIRRLMATLDRESFNALNQLAFMGSLPVVEAQRIISIATLRTLDEVGLLQITDNLDDASVTVFPPLLGEYLRHQTSRTRRIEFGQKQDSIVPDNEMVTGSMVSQYRNAVGNQSTTLASRIWEHWFEQSEEMRETWRKEPTASNVAPLLIAGGAIGMQRDEVEKIIATTKFEESNPVDVARVKLRYAYILAVTFLDDAKAVKIIENIRREVPELKAMADAVETHIMLVNGQLFDYEKLTADIENSDEYSRQFITGVQVECLIAAGRVEDAIALLDEYHPTIAEYQEYKKIHYSLALLFSGNMSKSVWMASERLMKAEESLHPGLMQAYSYVAASGMGMLGHFRQLDQVSSGALALTGITTSYQHFQRGLLSVTALAARLDGRSEYACRLADQANSEHRCGPFPCMLTDVVADLVYRRGKESADRIWDAAIEHLERGFVMSAIFLAGEAVGQGISPDKAALIAEAAEKTQSQIAQIIGRYVQAASQMDVAALRDVVAEFEETEAVVYLLRAAIFLAVALWQQGDIQAATQVADMAWQKSPASEVALHSLFEPLLNLIELSPREWEIVSLLSLGESPAEIASRIGVGVRTVESHFASIYRKTGVNSRIRLKEISNTWLKQPESRDINPEPIP